MKSKLTLLLATLITSFSLLAQEGKSDITMPAPQGGMEYYGDRIDEAGAIRPNEFLENMVGAEEMDVKLEAKIITCCKKKGCWMDLDLENGQTMKVRFKDYSFFVPKDADGKVAVVEGKARKEEIDVATLKHYAEDAGKSADEIASITEPEMAYTFEARGVIIK